MSLVITSKASSVDARGIGSPRVLYICIPQSSPSKGVRIRSLIGTLVQDLFFARGKMGHFVMFSRTLDFPAMLLPMTVRVGSRRRLSPGGRYGWILVKAPYTSWNWFSCKCLQMFGPRKNGEGLLEFCAIVLITLVGCTMRAGYVQQALGFAFGSYRGREYSS